MSGYTFEKKITLGNVLQIAVIVVAIMSAYFAVIGQVKMNTNTIERIEIVVQQNSDNAKAQAVLENEIGHIRDDISEIKAAVKGKD